MFRLSRRISPRGEGDYRGHGRHREGRTSDRSEHATCRGSRGARRRPSIPKAWPRQSSPAAPPRCRCGRPRSHRPPPRGRRCRRCCPCLPRRSRVGEISGKRREGDALGLCPLFPPSIARVDSQVNTRRELLREAAELTRRWAHDSLMGRRGRARRSRGSPPLARPRLPNEEAGGRGAGRAGGAGGGSFALQSRPAN